MVKTWVWIVIIAVIVIICISLCAVFFTSKDNGHIANVYVDGVIVYSVDLDKVDAPFTKEIVTEYGKNVLEIDRGKIRISDADCDNKECVRTGYISDSSAPIVCLPHRLVIKIEKEGDVDSVSK